MLRPALLMMIAVPLAACDGEGTGTKVKIDAQSDGESNSSIVADGNGSVSIKAPGFEGSVTLPKFQLDAEDFDINGLKLYPGSKIRDLHVDAEDNLGSRDKGVVNIAFDAPASLDTVKGWFRENLAKRGFKVEPDGNGFKGTTDDGDPFTLELSGDGDAATKGKIEVRNS